MKEHKVFLITGASTGIGAATAHMAVDAGYRVVLAARSLDKLEALSDELGREHARAVQCDVSDWRQQEEMFRFALEQFGRLDVVFANAGFSKGSPFYGGEDKPNEWRDMVLTNVYGAAATARLSLPWLVKTGGHFLITGSVVGHITSTRNLYSATKWAVTGIAQSVRNEMAGTGVRVTLIEPGVVDTPFWGTVPKPGTPELHADDVARAVLYAVSQPPHVDVNDVLIRPTGQPH
ncbi:SDR family oxidoreductase [Prosthecochloris sp. CIB 2401]|uniref:SDR family oxidoreductase n=1 Tax=Prosthecochloris sp. CIB 2401 TaxID=1868325 RepID=UPI00080ABE02|nr:SDR family oxidoreductase [Prosthecochloris sp. CIB 2401]ANT64534.1 putative oxidoreductase [Prosthecochloris sp. CIB 2401]